MNNQNKTIVLYNGQSQYDVLRYFIKDLATSFKQLGFDVEIVDLLKSSWVKDLERIVKEKNVFFFLSMNAIGVELKVEETSLYDYLNIPLFAFLVDHPMYHINRLNQGVKNLIVSCVDKTHISFLKTFLNEEYSKVFIPHGTSYHHVPNSLKSIKERNIDILFTGTFRNPDHFRNQWTSQEKYIAQLFDTIMERYLYSYGKTLIDIAEDVFIENGIDIEYMNHYKFWQTLINVDLYIRNKRRFDIISEISKIGGRIEIYGNGWENARLPNSSIKLNPSINFEIVQEKMRDSKVVLNTLPNFLEGGHERVFTTMLNGAVSLTDRNLFFENEFNDKEDIILYSLDQCLDELLESLLKDDEKLQAIADNGRKKVMEKHTWLTRAEKILETVIYHKFFIS
jgi:glycosyltransferase involved in cell wall biosynthesis